MLEINEIFESIQGEGLLTGKPFTFIRLQGCNLRCSHCDTKKAWKKGEGVMMSEEEIAAKVEEFGHQWVEITGGNPLLQNLQPLLVKLRYTKEGKLNNRRIELQADCSLNPMQYALISRVSLSPKLSSSGMTKYMHYEYMYWLNPGDEVKFVVSNADDFNEAIRLLQEYPTKAQVVMQPVHGKNGKWIVEKVLDEHIENVRVLPQVHKVFGLR